MINCKAKIKEAGATRERRCPMPVLPGQDCCPLHFIIEKRMLGRKQRYEKLFKVDRSGASQ